MFGLTLESTEPYLVVSARGPAPLDVCLGLNAFIAELCERGRHSRVLLDLSEFVPELAFTEHLQLGTRASAVLRRLHKYAVVVPATALDSPSIRAAKRGLTIETFLHRADAQAWLAD